MIATITEVSESFPFHWPFFIAQLVNFLLIAGLFVLAARAILKRGKGWEVPVWLVLSFFMPVVFPIIALIHFRKPKKSSYPESSASTTKV